MTTSLQTPVRAIQKHVPNVWCLLSRQSSTASSETTKNSAKPVQQSSNNSLIQPAFFNRNPRNLELMTIAEKPEGYHLDRCEVRFWHRLQIKANQGKVTAEVVYNNGAAVVSASSSEFGIRRFLYRPTDVTAYKTIGKVIAQRCLESGINAVFCDVEAEEGTKLGLLLEEAKKGGLSLEEADSYKLPFVHTRGVPSKPWDIIT